MAIQKTRKTSQREPAPPQQRLFAAVPVNDAVREQMRATRVALDGEGWMIRWVDPDLAHLTVKFFGDTRPKQLESLQSKLAFAAERSQPGQLATGGFIMLGPRKRPNVLSLEIVAADDAGLGLLALENLAQNVARQTAGIGAGGNERAFKAHLTLARFKDRDGAPAEIEQALAGVTLEPIPFAVDHLLLVRSVLRQEGPTYTTLAEWPLTGVATPEPDDHG